jgi:hypothetical protein
VNQDRPARTLRQLQTEFPQLAITSEICGPARVWVARGEGGHPWLVLSSDLGRFRAALGQPPTVVRNHSG